MNNNYPDLSPTQATERKKQTRSRLALPIRFASAQRLVELPPPGYPPSRAQALLKVGRPRFGRHVDCLVEAAYEGGDDKTIESETERDSELLRPV